MELQEQTQSATQMPGQWGVSNQVLGAVVVQAATTYLLPFLRTFEDVIFSERGVVVLGYPWFVPN
jgi:hypothetical protein